MNQDTQENWEEAKRLIQTVKIPDREGVLASKDESHVFGKGNSHQLYSYELPLESINGYETKVVYNVCPVCKMIWNKQVVMFRENPSVVYVHQTIRRGERQ